MFNMILESCNICISNYVSNTDGKSYKKVVESLINGERNTDKLVTLIHGRTLNKYVRETVRDSLEGNIGEEEFDLLW